MIFKVKIINFRWGVNEQLVGEPKMHFSHFRIIESIINVENCVEASVNIGDFEKIVR